MLSKTQIKYIQSLGQKKFRDEHKQFIAEGPKIAEELLTNSWVHVTAVYALHEWAVLNAARFAAVPITTIESYELEKISQLSTPNQVLVVVDKLSTNGEPAIKNKLSLCLDTIQDPGNLGTIIRIADWFGIDQVICSNDCADIYNPKVVQATMGSIARVKVFYTDLADLFGKKGPVKLYATYLSGTTVAQAGKIKEGMILIGNESKGISEDLLSMADEKITIPKTGKAESLNAAVATGIIISHLTGNG